jgi:hypothetical protein
VPPAFRVGDFRRRNEVFEWPFEYREQAMLALVNEFNTRTDREEWMINELSDLHSNLRFIDEITKAELVNNDIGIVCEQMKRAPILDTSAQDVIDRRQDVAREKRMQRAVPTLLRGFPGKRCMEHRSYAGIRNPRPDCAACNQVFLARRKKRAQAKAKRQ